MTGEAVRGRRILVAAALLVVAGCAREASGATAVPSTVTTTTLAPTTTVPPTTTTTAAPPADGHPARVVREQSHLDPVVQPVRDVEHHVVNGIRPDDGSRGGEGGEACKPYEVHARRQGRHSRSRDTARAFVRIE